MPPDVWFMVIGLPIAIVCMGISALRDKKLKK